MRKTKGFTLVIFIALLLAVSRLGVYSVKEIISHIDMPSAPTIIIDAGHGGFDGGAVGIGNTIEKDINLAISEKIYDMSVLNGFNAIMVRDSDKAVNDEGLNSLREKKASDIHNRLALAQQHPEAIYLSIHQNHFPQQKYWGTQVFYGPKNADSAVLAKKIQDSVRQNLQPDNKREIKPAEKNLYILYNTLNTAVLVECGFISNEEECARLKNPEYQQRIAFEIFSAVCEHIYHAPQEG